MAFAVKTTVSAERSRAEIEVLVRRHAGRDAEDTSRARDGRRSSSWTPGKAAVDAWVEQEVRRRWRCLLLLVRAKLEAVEARISGEDRQVTFEREFLAYVVVPSGETIYEAIQSGIFKANRLLPPVGEGDPS